ncbi:EscJ/YscJ/HrcJ family type III secretion inner membrane ring protein [Bordetella genomosp. 5]|uniref:Lipoprotein n=1 Tax=Bordetella genomosp. 5 TaxID=1395608 RepID=A0A261TB78_9BORD|nr:type III secretion inner membrane ring lipoprotein SctJ [Bordetella genomosp. 5]OZI39907.1 EscJ/YscJ/HrcJ family type III secretion inner membrane ring protein [Bordetella genomosp. 5]OZI46665.1 EscJ/YscJ/HrcJ family type III secretion inner membrane ring protein [Bordetella genomosp. 5]
MQAVSSLFPLSWTRLRFLAAALLIALLAACGSRVELFSAASESEANELLSVLLDSGIRAEKSVTKAGVAVSVDSAQVARALDILRSRGLPRERFDGMGQIFRKEGLVSSPLEERARYIYALSQELTNTLSQMDGVLAARVHVVLPERGGVGENTTPSTAAVFIKHQTGYNLDALQPQIRKLVTHAIPGLTEDRVSIALVSAQPAMTSAADAPVSVPATGLWAALAVLAVLVAGLGGALIWVLLRRGPAATARKPRHEPGTAGGAA